MTTYRNQSGFTLLEVILTVTLLGILGAVSIGMYFSYKSSTDLELTSQTLAQMLRRAQTLARSWANQSDWGVSVEDDALVLFRGDDFGARDTAFDETYPIPQTLQIMNTPTLTGTCETGAMVTVTITDTDEVVETRCRNGVFFAQPLQTFSLAVNSATAVQTDAAGNTSVITEISW
jgi:prepilin-type N-terminal cleavage/methylation domain-containing protein